MPDHAAADEPESVYAPGYFDTRLALDPRAALTEARALYARLGYEETAPHNDDMYADHWFGKDLLNKDLLSTDLLS